MPHSTASLAAVRRLALSTFLAFAATATVAQDPPGSTGVSTLRVAVASTAAQTGVISALARNFQSRNPGVAVQIEYADAIAALDRARAGAADLVITHHSESESVFMGEGYGLLKTTVMYGEFAIFGSPDDPLRLRQESDLRAMLRRLAQHRSSLFVPDRRSAAYRRLDELWAMAALEPDWPGYKITGADSWETLRAAALANAYAFADLGAYLAHRAEIGGGLVPLVRDNVALRNIYSAIVVDANRVAGAREEIATRFLDYLVSDAGQADIRRFGEDKFDTRVFTPAAHMDEGLRARRMARELEAQGERFRFVTMLAIALALAGLAATGLFFRSRSLARRARRSEERYALAVEGANDGIWDWDLGADRMYMSGRLRHVLDLPKDSLFVEAPRDMFAQGLHPDDSKRILAGLTHYLEGHGGELFEAECRWGLETDGFRWLLIRGKALWSSPGRATRMSGSITDITQRKTHEEALVHQALHDPLTGLPNRRLLLDRIDQAIRGAARAKGAMAVVVLGLDRFREINETLGYGVGDQILKEVGARLTRALRGSDSISRIGGDEFAILLPDVAGELYASHVAKKISVALIRPFDLEQHALHLGASLGIAIYPQHGEDADELIQHADIAMNSAKRTASARAIYDPEQGRGSVRRLSLANDLHEALARDALSVHFQPKIDLPSGAPTGMEALLRWDHPRQGRIPPDEIIPIAEQTGLIKPLTLWVLDAALQQQVAWEQLGLVLRVAINISVWSLQDPKFTKEVAEALERWAVPAQRLELEITESAMMSDPKRSLDILTQLGDMGIGLSVDDYGTGFSSLAYLKRLPVDTIKIDKSFVMNMDLDDGNAAIVRSTVELAHNLGLTVVAEGVENGAIEARLIELGCDTAQGYHYCRPGDAETCIRWLLESQWGRALSRRALGQ